MKRLFTRRIELIFIVLLCSLAFFLRSYALYRDLFFGYDQGRDAFQMQRILHGHLTLIGPTTGLDGVFLGPFFYYLLLPFYLIGNGNPMVAAYAMVFLHVLTVFVIYLFAKRIAGVYAGAFAAILFTFSHTNISYARWIANPTPLPLFALLAFGSLWWALEKRKTWMFVLTGMFLGLCFQLEAANAIWFIPTSVLIVATDIWQSKEKKKLIRFMTLGILVASGFILVSLPQILFELKWNFLISRNVLKSFLETHDVTMMMSIPRRIPLLFLLFSRAFFPQMNILFWGIIGGGAVLLYRLRSSFLKNRGLRIVLLWLFVPLFFQILYTGNHGNFWDYYIIAQHPVLYIVIGSLFALSSKRIQAVGLLVLLVAVSLNILQWKAVLKPYPDRYSLQKQVEAVNWIINDAAGIPYGVWVYTPSYQDEADRYVMWWVGQKRGIMPEIRAEQQPYIYLMVDDDGVFWRRRLEWIAEKKTFGPVLEEKRIGAFTLVKIQNKYWQQK